MGGGSNSASQAAERQEQQRQAMITQGIAATNKVFDDPKREAQVQDVLRATREMYFDELNKQKADVDRQNKFSLARDGMVGSRQAIDTGIQTGEDYSKGVLNAERGAQGAANNIRMADEEARRNLQAMVMSGLDATTAGQRSSASLAQNLEAARAGMDVSAVGTLGAGFADMYKRSRDRDAERRARSDAQSIYNTSPTFGIFSPNVSGWGGGGP